MFELISGNATHIPSRPALPMVASITLQAALVAAIVAPLLLVAGALPETPTMMAFVAAPPPPPPPPPPPAPAATAQPATPATTAAPATNAAPVEEPARIEAERPIARVEDGVPGGVEGGIPGGVVGGVVGGLLTELPPPPPPPPAPPARTGPVRIGGQIKEPTLLRRIEPRYPALAVHANIQGTVILEAIVDPHGQVTDVKVLRSAHRLLDEEAMVALRQWQYEPLILNGRPERFVLTVVLAFNLTEAS